MNRLIHSLVLNAILLLALTGPATAESIHVATTGHDGSPGTPDQPLLTIQEAVKRARPGDIIHVGPGEYPETVVTYSNGLSTDPIVLDGGNEATVHRVIINRSHWRLQNIRISGLTTLHGHLVYLRRGAHFTVVSNTVIDAASAKAVAGIAWEPPTTAPFGMDAASNCQIVNNRITGILASTALTIMGDNNLIQGNYVHDVGQADFVRLWGRANNIRGNVFTNNFPVEGVGNHIDFIQTFGLNRFGSRDHLIEGNKILAIRGGQLSQLEGNLVPEIRDWTFQNNLFAFIDLQASCTVPGVKYFNNLFYRCNDTVNSGAALNFGSRVYTTANNWAAGTNHAHGVQVVNNVFLDCGMASDSQGYYGFGLGLTNVVADYNFVAKGTRPVREDLLKREIGNPDGWDNFRWYEPHGINGGDPRFYAIDAMDFRIPESSILSGKGSVIEDLLVDFSGFDRPRPPSIGLFEVNLRPQPPSGLRVVLR